MPFAADATFFDFQLSFFAASPFFTLFAAIISRRWLIAARYATFLRDYTPFRHECRR